MKKRILIALVVVLALVATASLVWANVGDPYVDLAISISRVTSGTTSGGSPLNTSADDLPYDDGSDATGAPDWGPGSQTWDKITVLGFDQGGTEDPGDDVGGVVVLAFTDNVCLDGTGVDLYIYDAIGSQSVFGNESADIEVAIGSGSFAAAGSVSPGLGYALDVSGASPYFTRVRLTATDFAGQATSAGLDLDAVECLHSENISDISLSASPSSDVNPIGTMHTVEATISPTIEGVEVTFTITGPNSGSGSANTDSSGVATFAYTGSSPGTDSIVASVTFEGPPISATAVQKTWYDKFVSGGGQLIEASDGTKRRDWLVISFGGFAASAGASGYIGEWQVNFHNVGPDELDQSHFHTTNIYAMNFVFGPGGCIAMNFYATGLWNGNPGYRMIFRAEDAGEPNLGDNARIQLFNAGGTEVYDTHDEQFTDESFCRGTARTRVDNGNLQLDVLP